MTVIRHERVNDIDARERLLDEAFGEERSRKSSQPLREGRLPAEGLAFVAADGKQLTDTARLWNVTCGNGHSVLLLGPVAVSCAQRNQGIGTALIQRAISAARRLGHAAIVLVGDAPYYGRFGFSAEKTGALWMHGPFERNRLLGLELIPGALDSAGGLIAPTGRLAPRPDLATLVAADRRARTARRQAA